MTEQSPDEPELDLLEVLADERIAALLDKDWQRYRILGERMLLVIDEKQSMTGRKEMPANPGQ